jgi:predicted short-subunit dehydrogenase-like oxidoreductase (DUF2520 family)
MNWSSGFCPSPIDRPGRHSGIHPPYAVDFRQALNARFGAENRFCYAARMAAKPRITIVGAGNLASALATSLREAGYPIAEIVARSGQAPMAKARRLAKKIGGRAVALTLPVRLESKIVWFCVPDGEIAHAARYLAAKRDWKGTVALHSSGALTSDELSALRRRGAAVASAHPLMTFVRRSSPSVTGVPFAIEGDDSAQRLARRIIRDLHGQTYSIRKSDKVAYHAWGTFASPLLTALVATTERVAAAAGVKSREAQRRMLPILQQTLANYAALDAAAAFSGPLARGDVDTVSRHLRLLRRIPAAREVYVALARAALSYLPVKSRASLEAVLRSAKARTSKTV